jgi:predicted Zn-dependent protease
MSGYNAVAAKYDPQAAARLLSRLAKLSRPPEEFYLGSYFSSHPAYNIRIQTINHLLAKLNRQAKCS